MGMGISYLVSMVMFFTLKCQISTDPNTQARIQISGGHALLLFSSQHLWVKPHLFYTKLNGKRNKNPACLEPGLCANT